MSVIGSIQWAKLKDNENGLKPASCATADDINNTTNNDDICSSEVTEHIPAGDVIVEEDETKIADDVIGNVDIVGDLDKTNAVDDTIGSCTAVDVDGVRSADDIIGDVTVDTSKEWKH